MKATLLLNRPAMMTSPSVDAATVDPMVAVATEMTTERRMPARMTGVASGSSTPNRRWRSVMPTPRAASVTAGGKVVRPVSAFSKMGSRP